MAAYGHTYSYIQHICTKIVCVIASQYIYRQETDVHYTKIIQLWCNDTQLPCKGLQCQPNYPVTWSLGKKTLLWVKNRLIY